MAEVPPQKPPQPRPLSQPYGVGSYGAGRYGSAPKPPARDEAK